MGQAIIPLAIAAASAGASAYNTRRTERKQDQALAGSIRNQGRKQAEADAKVNAEVEKLKGSRSADERDAALASYTDSLRRNKKGLDGVLATPGYGSDAFQAGTAQAQQGVQQYAGNQAGLMSRMEAPILQRQGESFGRGYLGTDLALIDREAQGQAFLDEMRLRAIRRNPWIDAASQIGMSYAGGRLAGGMGGGGYGVGGGGTGGVGAPGVASRFWSPGPGFG